MKKRHVMLMSNTVHAKRRFQKAHRGDSPGVCLRIGSKLLFLFR